MQEKPYPFTRTEAEWRRILTPEQYRGDAIARHGGAGKLCASVGKAAG